jgi:hypothetical protein
MPRIFPWFAAFFWEAAALKSEKGKSNYDALYTVW